MLSDLHTEAMNYTAAHTLSIGMLVVAFVVLSIVYSTQRRFAQVIA